MNLLVPVELPTNTRKRVSIPVFAPPAGMQTWDARLLDPEFWRGVRAVPDAELWAAHREQKERLEAVHNITLELTTQLDLNAIIRQALELISNHLGVARGSIMLTDPSSMELVCRAVLYSQGDVRAANIPLGQ